MIPKVMSCRCTSLPSGVRTLASASVFGLLILSSQSTYAASDAALNYSATNYLYAPSSERESTFQSLHAKGKTSLSGPVLEGSAAGDLRLLLGSQVEPYLEVTELFLGTSANLNSKVQVHAGRKLEDWSHLDEQWKLGLFQPRFRWDYFHPESSGLTGFFGKIRAPGFQLLGFASPIFVPERGVPVAVNNGELQSPTAWFIPPSSKIALFDQETRIRYDLDIPPVKEMILHPSIAVRLRVGQEQGAWASAAYGYKPVNQLLLGHDAYLNVAPPIEVPATIRPRIIYHHLSAIEAGYQLEQSGLSISTIYEKPVLEPVPYNWTAQTASPALVTGSSFYFQLGSPAQRTRFDLGYLRRLGGNAPDVGRDAASSSVFETRYPFASAFRFGVNTPLRVILGKPGSNLSLSSRVIYDAIEDGALWMNELRFTPLQRWQVNFGADFLATELLNHYRITEESFISRYQVNNRVYAGVGYVF